MGNFCGGFGGLNVSANSKLTVWRKHFVSSSPPDYWTGPLRMASAMSRKTCLSSASVDGSKRPLMRARFQLVSPPCWPWPWKVCIKAVNEPRNFNGLLVLTNEWSSTLRYQWKQGDIWLSLVSKNEAMGKLDITFEFGCEFVTPDAA